VAATVQPLIIHLPSLTDVQWEALCDGCGRCCLCKFEDEESGEVLYTDIACAQLDIEKCRCQHYEVRHQYVDNCLDIRSFSDDQFLWLPSSCAYRLSHEGKPLPIWHPWLSGDADSVHHAGKSIRGKVTGSCDEMNENEIIAHIKEEEMEGV